MSRPTGTSLTTNNSSKNDDNLISISNDSGFESTTTAAAAAAGAKGNNQKTHSHHSSWTRHASKPGAYSPVEKLTTPLCTTLIAMTHKIKPFQSSPSPSRSSRTSSSSSPSSSSPSSPPPISTSTPSSSTTSYIFDNGTGTGVLTRGLKDFDENLKIFATDVSEGMVRSLDRLIVERRWKDVRTAVVDSMDLRTIANADDEKNDDDDDDEKQGEKGNEKKSANEKFTHSMSTFMIGSVARPRLAIAEMYRVTLPDGVLALAAWAGGCWGEIWEKAVRRAALRASNSRKSSYVAPRLMHEDWSDLDDVIRGVEREGWKVEASRVVGEVSWGWRDGDEVDRYVFGAGNPIVGLLMEGFGEGEVGLIRESFRAVVEEEYDGGREICERAILVVARKVDGG